MTQQEFFTRYTYNTRTDKLGGGAFGTVYKAYDNVLDKYVAIKISEVKTIGGKEFSLMDEFNAIKGLNDHTNIAKYEQLFSFDQPNGVFDFAIIQYYPDGNLKDLIKNEKLTQTEKEKIAKQILEGLSFLHHHKVVHRDMKPSNILIHKREGKNYIPKIADFGLSKKADPNAKSRFTNSFGGGTLEYSSPEQLRGQNLRFNTDLWAWAVIVYELFTEKPLFQPKNNNTASAENEKEIFEQILNKDISSSLKEIPNNWSNALLACLDRNPEARVKTANEIQNILNENTIILPPEKPEPPKGNDENDNNSGKKKSYKYLLWLMPVVIALASVLLYFSLNNKPAEAVENDNITDSVSTTIIDSVMVDTSKSTPIKIDENQTTKTETKEPKVKPILDNLKEKSNWRANYELIDEFYEGLARVKKNKKFGYVDKNGKLIISLKYEGASRISSEGLYFVKTNGKFGFINKQGKIIIPIIYDEANFFTEGLAGVKIGRKWGYINKLNQVIIPFDFQFVRYFNEGLAPINKRKYDIDLFGHWGYINKSGEIIIPIMYDSANEFENGIALVETERGKYYINKKGECVQDCPN